MHKIDHKIQTFIYLFMFNKFCSKMTWKDTKMDSFIPTLKTPTEFWYFDYFFHRKWTISAARCRFKPTNCKQNISSINLWL